MNERHLVLGGTGFLGREIVRRMGMAGMRTQSLGSAELDLRLAGAPEALARRLDGSATVTVCSGANAGAPAGSNSLLTAAVARACLLVPPARVCYISSVAVYGEAADRFLLREDSPPAPSSAYGEDKLESERLLLEAAELGGFELLILRPAILYGTDQDERLYRPAGMVRQALRNDQVELWGDGDEERDFLRVEDAAALVAMLAAGRTTGILNLASGRRGTFREIVGIIAGLHPNPLRVVRRERTRPPANLSFDTARLAGIAPGFAPTPINQGVSAIYHALARNHPTPDHGGPPGDFST